MATFDKGEFLKMIHVGIDGGKKGAISVLSENGLVIHKWMMPVINGKKKEYDIVEINRIFKQLQDDYIEMNVILEQASIMPINGRIAIASVHFCYGFMQGILTSLKIPYQIVRAREWQVVVLKGLNTKDTKQASIMFCQRRYPKIDFRATERSKNISDGLTDATCMAYFSFLQGK